MRIERVQDQEAIRLLRDGKRDNTTSYIAIAAVLLSLLGFILQVIRH